MRQAVDRNRVIAKMQIIQTARCGVTGRSVYLLDVVGQHSLGASHQFVIDSCALLQRAKTVHLNGGKMSEDIALAVIWFDEAKTFGVVEPLDN
ncbi:MAG: hypothetical protein QG554_2014, partial [Pseudomonadota bacterium]|nr:hypothetical protein [Pseudomonadota bacterium]